MRPVSTPASLIPLAGQAPTASSTSAWVTVLSFLAAYLLTRFFIKSEGHREILRRLLRRGHPNLYALTGWLMLLTLTLSMFLPNLVSVLAVLPLALETIEAFDVPHKHRRRVQTLLALGVIYAANIGGLASLVGSPANLLMMGVMEGSLLGYRDSGEHSLLAFHRWLLFGLPSSLTFLAAAWGCLISTHRGLGGIPLKGPPPDVRPSRAKLMTASVLMVGMGPLIALASWFASRPSAAVFRNGMLTWVELVVLIGFVGIAGSLMLPMGPGRKAALHWRDLVGGIPLKGALLAVGALGVGGLLEALGLLEVMANRFSAVLPYSMDPFWALAAFIPATIVLSELFSNSVTAVLLWAIAVPLALRSGTSPFALVLAISLASNTAFMSPLATPASSMAFGGLRGVSLGRMLSLGILLDGLAVLWLLATVRWLVPWALGL